MTVLEITVGHWPFSDQHLADQNLFWLANFTDIFTMGWQSNNLQNVLSSKNGRPISDPYFYHCMVTSGKIMIQHNILK